MLFEFKLPDIGEGVHEATVLEWKRAVGDAVEEGEVLAVVETDKVTAEIPSPRAGVIRSLGAQAGQSVGVGEVLARIEIVEEGGATVVGSVESSSTTLLEPSREGIGSAEYSRVEQDSPEAGKPPPPSSQPLRATPVARRIAAMEGIDLSSLRGSGPSGRILKADILEEIDSRRNGTRRRLSTLRRTAARNLETSWRIPAVVIHEFTAIDELVQARRVLNGDARGSDSPKLSYLPFFIRAAAVALKQYPLLNAWYDEQAQTVDPQDAANVGFALDSDQGLVVPVIEEADRLSLSEIQERINLRRSQASDRNLRIEHLRGGTFTVSNFGSIGGVYGRPMIVPPQVAVLGIGRIHQAPIARDGEPVVATVLPLSLVFDHRVCDGAYALGFLNSFMELAREPIRFLR